MPAATIIRADQPGYFGWHAVAARGQATILGYSYTKDGCRQMAVTPWVQRTRQNPLPPGTQIAAKFGKKYFMDQLGEYNGLLSRCWFREAIQNAVDAKARNVTIETKTLPDGRFEVLVTDDGTGMNEDIFYNKFLMPGESGKDGEIDSTGGFGDAKRILFWPWCEYTVYTNGTDGPLGIRGEGATPTTIEGLQATGRGTQIRVIMPDEQHVYESDAIWFIERCYLPRIKFTVNGRNVAANLSAGKEIPAGNMSDDLVLYHKPRSLPNEFLIRKNGLVMFEVHANEGIIKGTLIGELSKPSKEVLSKDRNKLKQHEWRPLSFVQEMATDRDEKLKPKHKSNEEKSLYSGTEKITAEVQNTVGKLYNVLEKHFNDKSNKKLVDAMAEEVELMVSSLPKAEDHGVFMPTPGMAKIIVSGTSDTLVIEAAACQLGWAADFYIVNETEEYKVPMWLRPMNEKTKLPTMDARPKKLARLWLEFCRLILIRLGYKGEFGIGWIFSTSSIERSGYTAAAYLRDKGRDWLLLNPFIGGNISEEKIYSLREPHHLNTSFALAIHECTHMVNHEYNHNVGFSSALTDNIAKVLPSAKLMSAVRDAVAAIKEVKELKKDATIADVAELVLKKMRTLRDNNEAYTAACLENMEVDHVSSVLSGVQDWYVKIIRESTNKDLDKCMMEIMRMYLKTYGTQDPKRVIGTMLDDMPQKLRNALTIAQIRDMIAIYYVGYLDGHYSRA